MTDIDKTIAAIESRLGSRSMFTWDEVPAIIDVVEWRLIERLAGDTVWMEAWGQPNGKETRETVTAWLHSHSPKEDTQ
jgi:hypothetical protein